MTSELRKDCSGQRPVKEKGPDDDDNDALASRAVRRVHARTGRIALDALPVYAFNVSQFANNILSQAFIGHLGSRNWRLRRSLSPA